MNTEAQLKEARLKIAFLEGIIKEQKKPSKEDDLSDYHRAVCLIPKNSWNSFKSNCAKLGITGTKVFKIAIAAINNICK